MVASFKHLRDEKSFCDVTIATEGQHTKAHKMILCACSPYFKNLLEQNPAKHPIIILKDVPFVHLPSVHELQYGSQVHEGDVLEDDDRVLSRVLLQQILEIWTAGAQDHLVSLGVLPLSGDSHVTERLLIPQVLEGGNHISLEVIPA